MKTIRLLALSALSGILFAVSWPATGSFAPLLFVAFVPLLFIEDLLSSQKKKGTFRYAYLSFFLWNLISTWWIYNASLFGAIMAIVCNSLFMAIVFALFHHTKKLLGEKQGYVALIFYWLAFEYMHYHWELSYPWLTLGNGFANMVKWVQWYEYTGVLGGSLWILIINLLVFFLVKKLIVVREKVKQCAAHIVSIAGLVALPLIVSIVIYNNYKENINPVDVVIIQPNIDPYYEKFDGLTPEEQLTKMMNLAAEKADTATDYIVGPETAIPRSLWIDQITQSSSYKILKSFVSNYPHAQLVLGASLSKDYKDGEEIPNTARKFEDAEKWYDHFNSAIQIDSSDNIQLYHKSKLVLGVEKMPFPSVFRHFQEFAFDLGGTTGSLGVQEERSVFTSTDSSVKIAPVVCWESVYGEYISDYILNGAQLIFIITNDGWWNESPGYKQHLAYARLRAIETRRSVARSANTGISCFINQRGDVSQATSWWVPAAIREQLNANSEITYYTRYGDVIGRIAAFISILLLLWTIVKRVKRKFS